MDIENKFNLTDEDYKEIHKMFLDKREYSEIQKRFNLSKQRAITVIAQIVEKIINDKKNEENKKDYESEEYSSFKELLLPCDDEPTVGSVKIKNNKIYKK